MIKESIVKIIKNGIQHYNHKKYWKYRDNFINNKKNVLKFYYLYKIKKMDSFNNASMGTNFECSAMFKSPPILPHGLNGIIISQFAEIGENVVIYHQVTIGSKDNETAPKIGNNVVIYPGAKIIGNINIGDNCIIGAGAVVTHNIEPNCIVAGVPAKIIKKIN